MPIPTDRNGRPIQEGDLVVLTGRVQTIDLSSGEVAVTLGDAESWPRRWAMTLPGRLCERIEDAAPQPPAAVPGGEG